MTKHSIERLHITVGWLAIAIFIGMGLLLEALHAVKSGYLLDVQNEARRHMWTLAHAHGTLIGLMNLALAFTVSRIDSWPGRSLYASSRAMLAATVLVPGGFLLGGITIYAGDPGLGVLLVPPGGLLLLLAAIGATRAAVSSAAKAKDE
jgi:hypothetical protein